MKLRNRCLALMVMLLVAITLLLKQFRNISHLEERSYTKSIQEGSKLDTFKNLATHDFVEEAIVDVTTLELWRKVNAKFRKSFVEDSTKVEEISDLGDETVEAIVVPHSHNDPGWLKTVNEYFEDQTRNILNNMLRKLTAFPNMTFVWAESVFLAKWWEELSDENKEATKSLLKSGRLEILGGGWVVPDEASTHYTSLINNFLEGHLWLAKNLQVVPKFSWSLDPFGYSSTLPYLYNRMGFEGAVTLRIHTDIKNLLYKDKLLEFNWRQSWDKTCSSDMRTLVLPFMLYNIKHQCGPSQQTCLLFDFRKIPGEFSESLSETVTDKNVKELAEKLSVQYRLKANMQKNNRVVLIPLGDDFRYDREVEWDQQYHNYMRLFDYINNNPDLKVKARFGVVSDFFRAQGGGHGVNQSNGQKSRRPPSLSGDFFPYSDRNNDYWTGFFSTRVWMKQLGRLVAARLHSAEVLHLRSRLYLKSTGVHNVDKKRLSRRLKLMSLARQSSALFQHHDAVTGTSKDFVMEDYRMNLFRALRYLDQAMESSLEEMMETVASGADYGLKPKVRVISELLDLNVPDYLEVSEEGKQLIAFNVLLRKFDGLVTIPVSSDTQYVSILKFDGGSFVEMKCQIGNSRKTLLSFHDVIEPHHFAMYKVVPSLRSCNVPKSDPLIEQETSFFVDRDNFVATFDSATGHLRSISVGDKSNRIDMKIAVTFQLYEGYKDGAYIFGPKKNPIELSSKNKVTVTRGSLFDTVDVHMKDLARVTYKIPSKGLSESGLVVEMESNMTRLPYSNLIVRVSTDINSGRRFFTDSNGFAAVLRERMPSLPVEANFYPATSYVFIETSSKKSKSNFKSRNKTREAKAELKKRLTIIMSDPHGVSSTSSGTVEVMLDRKLPYDDGRGMGSGVDDYSPTRTFLRLIPEEFLRSPDVVKMDPSSRFRHPSLEALVALEMMQRPPVVAAATRIEEDKVKREFLYNYPRINSSAIPHDVTLASLRNLDDDGPPGTVSCHLVLHRYATESYPTRSDPTEDVVMHDDRAFSGRQVWSTCDLKVGDLFPKTPVQTLTETSLTMMEPEVGYDPFQELCLNASTLNSYRVVF